MSRIPFNTKRGEYRRLTVDHINFKVSDKYEGLVGGIYGIINTEELGKAIFLNDDCNFFIQYLANDKTRENKSIDFKICYTGGKTVTVKLDTIIPLFHYRKNETANIETEEEEEEDIFKLSSYNGEDTRIKAILAAREYIGEEFKVREFTAENIINFTRRGRFCSSQCPFCDVIHESENWPFIYFTKYGAFLYCMRHKYHTDDPKPAIKLLSFEVAAPIIPAPQEKPTEPAEKPKKLTRAEKIQEVLR